MQPMTDAPHAPRRDPAPTRLAYRLNRMWLTPLYRSVLRIGVPSFCVVLAAGLYLGNEERRTGLYDHYLDLRRTIEERPEFMIKLMAIDGASAGVSADVREILPIDFPVSSFDLDLEEMRLAVAGLDAVAKAELRIRPGGILQLSIEERVPAVVWRGRDGLELLDDHGNRVAPLALRTDRPDLPLIAGDGAYDAVEEALRLFVAARPISDRVRGLVRMGERRWDVILSPDLRIMLPEKGAVRALERVVALHQAEDMLDRDLVTVDMRNSTRPTLRLAQGAIEELQRIKNTEAGGANE